MQLEGGQEGARPMISGISGLSQCSDVLLASAGGFVQ